MCESGWEQSASRQGTVITGHAWIDPTPNRSTNPTQPTTHQKHTQEALKELGEWASRYEMIAAMGYLALLLMVGKAVNNLGKAVKVRMCLCVREKERGESVWPNGV